MLTAWLSYEADAQPLSAWTKTAEPNAGRGHGNRSPSSHRRHVPDVRFLPMPSASRQIPVPRSALAVATAPWGIRFLALPPYSGFGRPGQLVAICPFHQDRHCSSHLTGTPSSNSFSGSPSGLVAGEDLANEVGAEGREAQAPTRRTSDRPHASVTGDEFPLILHLSFATSFRIHILFPLVSLFAFGTFPVRSRCRR